MKKALINVNYYDFDKYEENKYIIFDEEILEIGNMSNFKNNDYEIIDAFNKLLMPSLAVGHTHIYSTFARGMNVRFNPNNFQDILDQLWWKLDRNLTLNDVYFSGIVSAIDFLKNGVTTLIDHHASGEIKGSLSKLKESVVDNVGLRGIFCFETSDRFNVDDCISENIDYINNNKNSFTTGLFGMHASLSLSDNTLEKISEKIKDLPIHIHVAESEMDQDDCINKYEMRVVERLDKFNLLNKNSILSHCIHISKNELEILQDKDIRVALNVASNMNNSVGLPNYQAFKEHNIKCLIGNDGISSSITTEWLNLNFGMHLKDETPTVFSFTDIIDSINNTYEYVNDLLNIKIGKIRQGYKADMILVPYINPTPMNNDNAFGHILFGLANSFKVSDVWVDGKQLLKDYQVSNKLEKEYKKAEEYALNVWKRIEKEEM